MLGPATLEALVTHRSAGHLGHDGRLGGVRAALRPDAGAPPGRRRGHRPRVGEGRVAAAARHPGVHERRVRLHPRGLPGGAGDVFLGTRRARAVARRGRRGPSPAGPRRRYDHRDRAPRDTGHQQPDRTGRGQRHDATSQVRGTDVGRGDHHRSGHHLRRAGRRSRPRHGPPSRTSTSRGARRSARRARSMRAAASSMPRWTITSWS